MLHGPMNVKLPKSDVGILAVCVMSVPVSVARVQNTSTAFRIQNAALVQLRSSVRRGGHCTNSGTTCFG